MWDILTTGEETKNAWLAGLVDADGTITLKLQRVYNGYVSLSPHLAIHNTSVELLDCIKEVTGLGHRDKTGKRCYSQLLVRRDAIKWLQRIYPYLIVKRERCRLVLEWQKHRDEVISEFGKQGTYSEYDLNMYLKIRSLQMRAKLPYGKRYELFLECIRKNKEQPKKRLARFDSLLSSP